LRARIEHRLHYWCCDCHRKGGKIDAVAVGSLGFAERHPRAAVIIPPRLTVIASETKASQRDTHRTTIAEHARMSWQRCGGGDRTLLAIIGLRLSPPVRTWCTGERLALEEGKWKVSRECPNGAAIGGRHVHRQHGRSPSVPPDPSGMAVGANNLFIADASVMPGVSRTNPTPYDHDRRAHRQVGAQACDA
jgi:hypothetical protein